MNCWNSMREKLPINQLDWCVCAFVLFFSRSLSLVCSPLCVLFFFFFAWDIILFKCVKRKHSIIFVMQREPLIQIVSSEKQDINQRFYSYFCLIPKLIQINLISSGKDHLVTKINSFTYYIFFSFFHWNHTCAFMSQCCFHSIWNRAPSSHIHTWICIIN